MPGKRMMPPIGDSVASGNRMSAMNAAEMRAMRNSGMPPIADSIASGNRMSAMNAAEMRGMKMINEGPMSPNDMRAMGGYGKKAKRK
jgi:hypothetical protein